MSPQREIELYLEYGETLCTRAAAFRLVVARFAKELVKVASLDQHATTLSTSIRNLRVGFLDQLRTILGPMALPAVAPLAPLDLDTLDNEGGKQ